MKLYQTKTIEDFNDLISKLYKEGYSFKDGTPLIDRNLRLNFPEYLVDERDSIAFENVIFGGGVVDRETKEVFKGFFDY